MNPDYYKKNEYKTYKHELERVTSMTDDNLKVRYDKMTKPQKIGAFYEALTDENRAPELRKKMEADNDIVEAPPQVSFVKVIANENEGDDITQQALFYYEDGDHWSQHFLYSYRKNKHINETMTFHSDENGAMKDGKELFAEKGYVHSNEAMNATIDIIRIG